MTALELRGAKIPGTPGLPPGGWSAGPAAAGAGAQRRPLILVVVYGFILFTAYLSLTNSKIPAGLPPRGPSANYVGGSGRCRPGRSR